MAQTLARLLPAALLPALLFTAAFAQTTNARLEGVVQDPTGAVVPGAKVSVVNVRTQFTAQSASGPDGAFVFTALRPGVYSLSVEASGFTKSVLANIELNVGATLAQVVKLEVGQTSETVVVEASAVTVQTTESQVSRAVTMRDIDTLPQLARTPITLSVFQPGVSINAGDVSFSRVNGLRQGSNNSKLDGIDVNDSVVPRLGLSMTANNTDSIGEFRIVLNGGKAEYGRNAGGQVELITRSGTNEFHGNAFDYLRNTKLHANDFFSNQSGAERPKFIQNIFGGSFGGPVLKDRTFVFGNYQGRRTRQETVRNRTVLTSEAKRGIFRYRSGGAIQSYSIAANDPRGKGVDPEMAKIFALVPDPNNTDVGDGLNTAGFRFNNPSNSMEDQYTIKGDHNITSANRAFFRWSWQRNSSIDSLNSADATYPGMPHGTQGGKRWGFSIGDDWSIRPTVVNEFRIGYQKAVADFLRPGRLQGPTIITNLLNPDPHNSAFPQGRYAPVIDVTENLTWMRNKHVFKLGGQVRRTLQHGFNDFGIYPDVYTQVAYGNNVAASIGPPGLTSNERSVFEQMYNDVLGRVSHINMTFYSDLEKFQAAGTPSIRDYVLNEGGLFFQDDWRVTRKLTLNLGVRWEYFLPPQESNGFQGVIDRAALVDGVNQITDLRLQRGSSWFGTDRNNFAPRFGFAYDPTGSGRTSIRGAYGIFYDRMMGSVTSGIDSYTPGFSQTVPSYPNAGNNDVRASENPALPAQPGAPVLQLPLTRSTTVRLQNPNLRTGYVQSYNFTIQREVLRNTVVEVGWVGNRGVKLFMLRDVNQPRIFGELLNSFKEMQAFVASSSAAPSASNVFVRLYGTPQAAVTALGATNFSRGLVGTVVNSLDRTAANYNRFAGAGLPATYVRNYPQFNQVQLGTNDGRSYYDSLQLSVRRSAGALRTSFNYTWGHALDNIGAYSLTGGSTSSAPEGNGFAPPIDSYNARLMRATADFDRRHVFNGSTIYTLPVGNGKRLGGNMPRWADALIGGWDIGLLTIWQSGGPYTVLSQRFTTGVTAQYTWANYSGAKGIGSVQRKGYGVWFLGPDNFAQFSYPAAGETGSSGRNTFRMPRFFNVDASLVKRFRITESHVVTFRAEAYNLFNNPNFGGLSVNLNTPASFGKLSSTLGAYGTNARVMQMTLRYDF